MKHGAQRLLDQFCPEHYNLHISLDAKKHRFSGKVVITGRTAQKASKLKLHTKGLTIRKAMINEQFAAANLEADELTLQTPHAFEGPVTITIEFSGKITDSLHGFYPGRYRQADKQKELFLTQFESHHAREVFPCIDEPAAKATFSLTLTTKKDLIVLANTPEKTRKSTKTKQTITFEKTPRMSTYLLAWVIGELHHLEATSRDGTLIRVWATRAQDLKDLEFALSTAVKSVEFFNDYFGVPYPLPKLDHVAIPDFSAGAMENWGLITYREVALLVNKTTPVDAKQYVAIVISHETAHQWFGNLVTMAWWDDLWLNESFANMMEYVATDAIYPEMHIWKTFLTCEAAAAFRRDAIPGVQAVQTPVHHPDEISSLFDPAIVYAKGARLLNMVRLHIGDEAFRRGLQHYFTKHQYRNTTGSDLWAALSEASDTNIAELVTPWLTRPHYPVLSVKKEHDTISLAQSPFVFGDAEPTLWPLPLHTTHDHAPTLLDKKQLAFRSSKPVWFNPQSTTHSLTHYDKSLRRLILDEVRTNQRDELARIAYLMDASLLAKGGHMPTQEHLATLTAYAQENSDHAWRLMSALIGQLRLFVETDSSHELSLRRFARELARPQFETLGLHAKTHEDDARQRLRGTIVDLMVFGRDQSTIEHLLTLYRDKKLATLSGDTRTTVLSTVVIFGTNDERRHLLERYSSATPNEVVELTQALSGSKDPAFIDQITARLLDASFIRHHDVPRWFMSLMSNRHARQATWDWLRANWDEIVQRFDGDKHYDDFPRYAAMTIASPQLAASYREFFADKTSDPALTRAIAMGEQEIAHRLTWIARDQAAVLKELETYASRN